MSTPLLAAPRGARRLGVIASLIAAAAMLTGCSSGADSSYGEPGVADAGFADGGADAPAFSDEESAEGTQRSTADRAVIITGTLYMTVEDPIVAADRAAGIVKNAGGRIDARSETAPDESYGGSASLTLRIPSSRLDAVVDDLRELGTVDQYSTDSYDVTTEVTDLESRISTLRASTKRIERLLAEAEDISDIITLENELDGRQAELESLEAHQRGLNDQVSMSTIDLSLTTEPVVIVEDDGPETFWDGLTSGWDALATFLTGVLVVIGVLLPWLALMALIFLAVLAAIRVRRSRIARRAPAATAPTATAPQASEPPGPPTA
ncbi:DUF4349 domain-containing protein [Demequina sp.]|uniref:DUF4349 domain-containing protein n=1 Tax=Demequina sp. TaxID=2050685 RepID=UPI0025C3C25F|nr:DUF4349 domain-containing protein [Demequina sp.]